MDWHLPVSGWRGYYYPGYIQSPAQSVAPGGIANANLSTNDIPLKRGLPQMSYNR